MLRASLEKAGGQINLRPIATGTGTTGVRNGREIIEFTDAVVLHDTHEFPQARAALETAAGRNVADRAALVAGNFSMMNRSLDAIGAPIGNGGLATATALGVEIPSHLL